MIILENNYLKVGISEGRSLKVISFFDKRRKKEWVWRPEKMPENLEGDLSLTENFDDFWSGGWEEVFPNDAPTNFGDFILYDHGEVWRRRWEVIFRDENEISAKFECVSMPFTLNKTLFLSSNNPELLIEYKITNNSSRDLPYIFKFHPALSISEGDQFFLPKSLMRSVELNFSRILGGGGEENFPYGLSSNGKKVRIDKVLKNDGYTREFIKTKNLKEGECSLYNQESNSELSFSFPLSKLPNIWLFLSYGGFLNHYVAMMEPCNTFHYDLAETYKTNNASILKGMAEESFSIKIRIKDL